MDATAGVVRGGGGGMEAEDGSPGKLCGMHAAASRRTSRALPNMRGVMVYSLSFDSLSQWIEGRLTRVRSWIGAGKKAISLSGRCRDGFLACQVQAINPATGLTIKVVVLR